MKLVVAIADVEEGEELHVTVPGDSAVLTHAASQVVFDIPPGKHVVELRAEAEGEGETEGGSGSGIAIDR